MVVAEVVVVMVVMVVMAMVVVRARTGVVYVLYVLYGSTVEADDEGRRIGRFLGGGRAQLPGPGKSGRPGRGRGSGMPLLAWPARFLAFFPCPEADDDGDAVGLGCTKARSVVCVAVVDCLDGRSPLLGFVVPGATPSSLSPPPRRRHVGIRLSLFRHGHGTGTAPHQPFVPPSPEPFEREKRHGSSGVHKTTKNGPADVSGIT